MSKTPRKLVLASSSPYRQELLRRLTDAFESLATDIEESPAAEEHPADLAARLAGLKASAGAERQPEAIIIGSDQVASLNGMPLGKPGSHERAVEQLRACSGQTVEFYTAVCVHSPDQIQRHTDQTSVRFRTLSDALIEAYLRKDEPYDCAGSFKAEKSGVVLFEAINSSDPTGLIGLPLIWLSEALRTAGIDVV
ncbi:MAG: Maf family protein [Gammaproteobacteria bacterium]